MRILLNLIGRSQCRSGMSKLRFRGHLWPLDWFLLIYLLDFIFLSHPAGSLDSMILAPGVE